MLKNGYATKKDLKDLEHVLKGDMTDLKNEMNNLKDEVTNVKVEVLGELKKMQENDAAHQFSHMRINDDIQELQGKVKKLETAKN